MDSTNRNFHAPVHVDQGPGSQWPLVVKLYSTIPYPSYKLVNPLSRQTRSTIMRKEEEKTREWKFGPVGRPGPGLHVLRFLHHPFFHIVNDSHVRPPVKRVYKLKHLRQMHPRNVMSASSSSTYPSNRPIHHPSLRLMIGHYCSGTLKAPIIANQR